VILRVLNAGKIVAGYLLSRISRAVIHYGKPLSVSIEPTNKCNLHCPECPSGMKELTRPRGNMEMDLFRSIMDQLSPELSYLTLYFQGEPYMNSHFTEMVRYARSKKIYVTSSTNGHFMTREMARKTVESGLNRLIVSLDGTDQTAYESYRVGGSLEQVTRGISQLVEVKREMNSSHPRIIVQFLVLKSNEHQVEAVKKLGRSLGVDKVELKSAQFYAFKQGNPLMPVNLKYARYRRIGQQDGEQKGKFILKNSFPSHCFRMWSGCVITWDGEVVPCCYDKDATHSFGNIGRQPFTSIWRSKSYDDFRRQILHHREKIAICQNCTEGMGFSAVW
jgi:radical SAM protein with 4Fe4S-binding SPASM domain